MSFLELKANPFKWELVPVNQVQLAHSASGGSWKTDAAELRLRRTKVAKVINGKIASSDDNISS